MRVAAQPRLYDARPEEPLLSGVECGACGRVYFPPIGLGCEVCGADALVPASLPAVGVVHAVARVYAPASGTAPFTMVEVLLDGGPLIRAIVHGESREPEIGDRVAARWQVTEPGDTGEQVVEPAFDVVTSVTEVQA
ncbi:hypothetical protein B7C42_07763 [Nocardia cerradoensis]|uniref:Uncharacterized protein n=1 Tax=Nocardia cerradoensis TaxID=85688 RepID=A0A231GUM7_9NOCA|nr:zinc ribbon domain-containing protein [Nocardia cerradoensis]OXR40181.1 hypothetical protein B7C42_07763 [Nocardia cerradoensis]